MVIAQPTAHLMEALPVAPRASIAVTVAVITVIRCGVPEMTPVAGLIDKPAGSPVALYVSVWAGSESAALTWTLIGMRTQDCSLAGAFTVTVLTAADGLAGETVAASAWVPAAATADPDRTRHIVTI